MEKQLALIPSVYRSCRTYLCLCGRETLNGPAAIASVLREANLFKNRSSVGISAHCQTVGALPDKVGFTLYPLISIRPKAVKRPSFLRELIRLRPVRMGHGIAFAIGVKWTCRFFLKLTRTKSASGILLIVSELGSQFDNHFQITVTFLLSPTKTF